LSLSFPLRFDISFKCKIALLCGWYNLAER
jgi:hypothetical protein